MKIILNSEMKIILNSEMKIVSIKQFIESSVIATINSNSNYVLFIVYMEIYLLTYSMFQFSQSLEKDPPEAVL